MDKGYWLVARDKPGLLAAMMKALAGDAHISFEGDLSRCHRLFNFPGASTDETEVLHRATIWPKQDFVVLPMEPEMIRPILDEVLPEGRVVHDIIHVQIERKGQMAFAAYDNFHRSCVVCWGDNVSHELLERLRLSGVLRSWELNLSEPEA